MAHDPRFRVERVVTLALVAAACAFALYHDRALPAPLGLDAPASVFSEARAAAFASSLDAPRLAGSDAEHAALDKLERALRGVAAETRAASSGRVVVDVLRTRHSGTFPLRGPGVRETREQTMAYDRLDALAARVRVSVPFGSLDDGEAERHAERHALLFAAHVDTVHVSPGGCDNAANVAVVLETVRAFAAGLRGSEPNDAIRRRATTSYDSSSNDTTYVTPLIVMFVSAEEDGFMGARGVVRDHPWFEAHVAAFANFEAMGSGGPHRAFRATVGGSSSNVLRLYALGAPRPSGTVLASDVFSSGFIKSDTDFRVFRDDGDVPGIDLAFVERTRLYHTPRDTIRALVRGRPGSMQGSGENALGFARAFFENSVMMRSIDDTRQSTHQKDGKGRRFLGVTKGGVSTTARRSGVRRGAKETASSETSSLKKKRGGSAVSSLTVWFAFPSFQNAFVVFDVDGAQMATAVALAAVTSTALATNLLGFGFGARIERDPLEAPRDTATLLAAIVVGVAGAAVAFVAAPVAGGLAALATASFTGTPTPWAKSLGAFVLCVVPSSVAAALGTLDATRRLTRVLFESAANDSNCRFQSRRDSFAATTTNETRGEQQKNANETSPSQDAAQRTASHVTRLHARADRVALVGAALFLALLASYAFFRNVAGAYLFAVPAFGIFLGVPFAGTEDDHSMDPSRSRKNNRSIGIGSFAFGAFARAAPLAFAASLAFPTCFALVDLAHGMAPRSRPPPGTSEYLYDIVCGVVAGGAVAASAFPSLAFLVSVREDSRESESRTETRSVFRFSFAKAFVLTIAASHVAYAYAAIDAPSFTEDFPQQVSAFAAVTSGNVSDAALVFLPAGPGSVERAFKQTLEQLERLGSFGSFTSPSYYSNGEVNARDAAANGEDALSKITKITKNTTKYACDDGSKNHGHGVLRRWDLASYSLAGSGACAALSTSLSRELTEAEAKSSESGNEIVTEVRVRAGAPRAVAGNARVVPITVDTRGATRWVIAVDARCAKRVAFAQGQDAEREDAEREEAEAEAEAEAGERRAGNRDGGSSMKKPTRASPPVGPWRLASNGRAGSGTGTRRYAAFGVGGRDARERPRPITVWIETHAVTDGDFETDGAVSKKCARDAVRVRADFDFETATAAAARAATPAWVVPFAKHHTPLKLAVLAVAGLNMTEGHAAVT
jgi:hypothetical protein